MRDMADSSAYSRVKLGEPLPPVEYTDRRIAQAAASKALLDALQGKPAPDKLVWTEQSTPGTMRGDSCFQMQTAALRISKIRERDERADALRVNRDPCPYCATRADMHDEYGCGR